MGRPGSTSRSAQCLHRACATRRSATYFSLTVAVSSSYWNDHTGSTSISITWKSSTDHFDLYVYKGGHLQKSSSQVLGTSEAVSLSRPQPVRTGDCPQTRRWPGSA